MSTDGEVHIASLWKLRSVFVVNTVRVENSRLMASSSSEKTFILSAHLRRCFGKDQSGGKSPSLEYPGRPEMPWPSSEGGCGCPWCSSSCGVLAASTPASTRRPPAGMFEVSARLGPEWCILSPGQRAKIGSEEKQYRGNNTGEINVSAKRGLL